MLKAKINTLEGEIEHGEERRTEQLNKILELENDKRLSTQEKSALERDYKERERRCETLDEKVFTILIGETPFLLLFRC